MSGVYYEPNGLTFAQARTQLVQDVDHWARGRAARDGYVWKTAIGSYLQSEHQRYAHSDAAKIIADLKRERGWTEDRDGLLRPGHAQRDRDPERTPMTTRRAPSYTYATPEIKRTASFKRALRLEELLAPKGWTTPGLSPRNLERVADAWDRAGFLGWADNYRAHARKVHGRGAQRDRDPRPRKTTRATPSQRRFISEKIRLLRREGRSEAQAVAIALRMAGVSRRSRRLP